MWSSCTAVWSYYFLHIKRSNNNKIHNLYNQSGLFEMYVPHINIHLNCSFYICVYTYTYEAIKRYSYLCLLIDQSSSSTIMLIPLSINIIARPERVVYIHYFLWNRKINNASLLCFLVLSRTFMWTEREICDNSIRQRRLVQSFCTNNLGDVMFFVIQ